MADVVRRLVAIFAADVEGYSRLMGTDEVGTLKGLTERRAILDRLIGEHRGRIANTAGGDRRTLRHMIFTCALCSRVTKPPAKRLPRQKGWLFALSSWTLGSPLSRLSP